MQPVFTQHCALSGCHSGLHPSEGLTLSSGTTFAETVGVASVQAPSLSRVAAGDPDSSYLVDKIEGTQTAGAMMPLNGGVLTALEILLVRKWIEAGALDN